MIRFFANSRWTWVSLIKLFFHVSHLTPMIILFKISNNEFKHGQGCSILTFGKYNCQGVNFLKETFCGGGQKWTRKWENVTGLDLSETSSISLLTRNIHGCHKLRTWKRMIGWNLHHIDYWILCPVGIACFKYEFWQVLRKLILEVGVLVSSSHVFYYFRENWKCSDIFTTKASLSCPIWIVASNIKSQPYLLNLIPENQYSLGNIGTVANYSIKDICV